MYSSTCAAVQSASGLTLTGVAETFHLGRLRAGFGLFAAYAGSPGAERCELAFQRADFAYVAAEVARFDTLIEEVLTADRHHFAHFGGVRQDDFRGDPIVLPDSFDHAMGLRGKTAGIEREDTDARRDAGR